MASAPPPPTSQLIHPSSNRAYGVTIILQLLFTQGL